MQFDHGQLRDLLEQLGKSDIQEFRLEGENFRLEVRRNLPVTVTASLKATVTLIASPALYEPFAVVADTPVTVGAVVS
ncbi:MAG: acetyl-CoA carboxylase, biotin carboxyl carrier protein, partial [Cyanobacteriota bacterium]